MKQFYMVELELPELFVQNFTDQIKEQRKKIEEFMSQGTIKSYSLSLNRSKLWMILSAYSEFEVMDIISDLPSSEFMVPSIAPLMFHNTNQQVPSFSLN